MHLNPPVWWYEKGHRSAVLLRPVSALYGRLVEMRWRITKAYKSKLPVICVGNLTAGGAGKTPTAISIAKILKRNGAKPVFLTRGYKGKIRGPHLVGLSCDLPAGVGDEPLLLAAIAPTVVAKDRAQGAQFIEKLDASVIIMDDGFQNPTLYKDFALAVVDAEAGIGNGEILPAGPLRARLAFQLNNADGILAIGERLCNKALLTRFSAADTPLLRAQIAPDLSLETFLGKKIIAYCGIGRPEKFFRTLADLGANICARRAFPDHHFFTEEEAEELLSVAKKNDAMLVTTQKDLARLTGAFGALNDLAKNSHPLPISVAFQTDDEVRLAEMIFAKIKK